MVSIVSELQELLQEANRTLRSPSDDASYAPQLDQTAIKELLLTAPLDSRTSALVRGKILLRDC